MLPVSSSRLVGSFVALSVAAGAGASAAHAAPTQLASEPGPTRVAAYAGIAMWSTSDTTGRYHLVKSVDGAAPVAVGVPDREGPFDVDLGTNRSGSPYAVYTRDGLIYRLNVATGAEQRLTKLSIGGLNQRPTIQRGEIAFLHSGRGHSELRIGNTTSGAKPPRVLVRGTIDDIELGIGKVAYTLRSGRRVTVHVRNIRTGHDNAVYRASSGGANTSVVTKPSFTDDLKAFVWARADRPLHPAQRQAVLRGRCAAGRHGGVGGPAARRDRKHGTGPGAQSGVRRRRGSLLRRHPHRAAHVHRAAVAERHRLSAGPASSCGHER
jgi:hypothetical protein